MIGRTSAIVTYLAVFLFTATIPALPAAAQETPSAGAPEQQGHGPEQLTVAPGDTLDGLLASAGLPPRLRAEAALAVQAEFDLRELRPGHTLELDWADRGLRRLQRLTLNVDDGVRIELDFDEGPRAHTIEPEAETESMTARARIDGSLYDTLAAAGAPSRFAVEIAGLLGGVVDFRRELRGGEQVALAWRERRNVSGARLGEPILDYARVELSGRVLELVAPDGPGSATVIYEDGEPVQRAAAPVIGARLSSVFGRRVHPVYGGTRMHTGVDYAAARGTPVTATGAGCVARVGRLRGYGRVIDIDHGGGVMTRYAHLRAVADAIKVGDRVSAGQLLGAVGATGTATGPNLHYEVRLDGRPVDPFEASLAATDTATSPADRGRLTVLRRRVGLLDASGEAGAADDRG